MTHPPAPAVRRFIGVYNAEGTLRGELVYWFGRRRGTVHCGLCDITHGRFTERADWRESRTRLPVPFDTYHLDDQPDDVRPLTAGRTPAVIADTDAGPVFLLGPADLDACEASPAALIQRITQALLDRGLTTP